MAVKTKKRSKKSLEDKLREVKLDTAVIQSTRTEKWHEFRKTYEDFIFRERVAGFIFGLVIGAILIFILLLSVASTL
jgi:hypothetical protein